jgi:hypothetical protein
MHVDSPELLMALQFRLEQFGCALASWPLAQVINDS